MQTRNFALSRRFVDESIATRSYASRIAELAADLARKAGEVPDRPLSQGQIDRAVDVNGIESRMVMDALVRRLEQKLKEGELPEDASVPVW